MADPTKATKFHGVPFDLIQEASKLHEKVLIYVNRRNAKGQLEGLGHHLMDTAKLTDIEAWLKNLAGGGEFNIRPVRQDNHAMTAEPLPKTFAVYVEGPPKPVTSREHGIDGMAGISAVAPFLGGTPDMSAIPVSPWRALTAEEQARLPAFMHSMPLAYQHEFLSKQRPQMLDPMHPAPPAYTQPNTKYTSDELAFEQTKHFRDELAELKKKQELRDAENAREKAELLKRLDEEKEARREATHRAELAALTAKLEALSARPAVEEKKSINWMEYLPALAPFVPVFTELVRSSGAKATIAVEQQQKTFEAQMKSVETIMKLQPQQKDSNKELFDMVIKLSPLVAPVISKFIESRGPEAQANMWATNAENQLNMIAMIGQLTQELAKTGAGGGEPWYLPMVQNLLGTVMTGVQAMVDGQKKSNPMGPEEKKLPAGTVEQEGTEFTQGQQIAKMIFAHPQFPQELKTQEWFDVIGALHDNVEPKDIAPVLADFLIKLENEDKIPQVIQEDWNKDPKQTLLNIFAALPVGQQNPDYVNLVVDSVVEILEAATDDEEATTEQPQQAQQFNIDPKKQKQAKQQATPA